MSTKKIIQTLSKVARIWSILSIGFLLFMIFGHIFSTDETSAGFKPIELVAFLFFPIGVAVGMIIGWKKELLGGIITTISLIIFTILILIPRDALDMGFWIFFAISGPGILFLINGLIKRSQKPVASH